MTTLERELKLRGISIYLLCKLLDKDPMGSATRMSSKIAGRTDIPYDELKEICRVVSKYSREPLKVDDLKSDIIKVNLK